jgi:sterol desaturase/sphingolipid hydroxylase (fatty acid hydroxylase superfamily)
MMSILAVALVRSMSVAWVFPILFALERLLPMAEKPSLRAQARALTIWPVFILLGAVSYVGFSRVREALHLAPLISLPVLQWLKASALQPVAWIVAPLVGLLFFDLVYYWFHRLQHSTFLWRLHSAHHAITDLSAINSYHHWSEDLVRSIFIGLPLAVVFDVNTGPKPEVLATFSLVMGHFTHSPLRLHFGLLNRLVMDNRTHRIHHSLEPRHFNKNFGTATTIWDQVFGTAYFPAKGEWPATGLADVAEARGAVGYLLWTGPKPVTAMSPTGEPVSDAAPF